MLYKSPWCWEWRHPGPAPPPAAAPRQRLERGLRAVVVVVAAQHVHMQSGPRGHRQRGHHVRPDIFHPTIHLAKAAESPRSQARTGDRTDRPPRAPAPRPAARRHNRNASPRADHPAPDRAPRRAPAHSPPRYGDRHVQVAAAAQLRSNRACLVSDVSMWSKKPIPVCTSASPDHRY